MTLRASSTVPGQNTLVGVLPADRAVVLFHPLDVRLRSSVSGNTSVKLTTLLP